ncbi:MAG: hypothetical protein JXR53_14125 [Bacteroidales bacterium]|nr:hypothetical protein [Bacteroidales bacterium]
MSILNNLASVKGLKGNDANILLAKEITETNNSQALVELVDNLSNKNKNIQSDCIKVIYETAYITPELIADYYEKFFALLSSRNNRLVWGAMIAISTITLLRPQYVFSQLDLIMNTVAKGSVITIDCGIEILARLNMFPEYQYKIEPLLSEQLWKCPIKQLPMYIEKALISIGSHNQNIYVSIIEKRMDECSADSQKKRLFATLKKIEGLT